MVVSISSENLKRYTKMKVLEVNTAETFRPKSEILVEMFNFNIYFLLLQIGESKHYDRVQIFVKCSQCF